MATDHPLLSPPDHVVLGAAGVGEEHLGELGGAVDLLDGPHLDAGLVHRAQQVGDALVLGGVLVGPAQDEDVVGDEALGGPDLLTVDDPLVAVELGGGLQAGQVGAGVGLGEALAPGDGAGEDAGDELLLLLLGAPLQDGGADEGVAEEVATHRGAGPGELLGEDHALHGGEALAAVLRGPGGADPTALEELGGPVVEPGPPLLVGHLEALVEPTVGQVVLQPAPDLDAELLGFGRVGEVHGDIVPLPPGSRPLPDGTSDGPARAERDRSGRRRD